MDGNKADVAGNHSTADTPPLGYGGGLEDLFPYILSVAKMPLSFVQRIAKQILTWIRKLTKPSLFFICKIFQLARACPNLVFNWIKRQCTGPLKPANKDTKCPGPGFEIHTFLPQDGDAQQFDEALAHAEKTTLTTPLPNELVLWVDGSYRPSDNVGGAGVVVQQGEQISSHAFSLPHCGNSCESELYGIICGLKLALMKRVDEPGINKISVFCDSTRAIGLVRWASYRGNERVLGRKIAELRKSLGEKGVRISLRWAKSHITTLVWHNLADKMAGEGSAKMGEEKRAGWKWRAWLGLEDKYMKRMPDAEQVWSANEYLDALARDKGLTRNGGKFGDGCAGSESTRMERDMAWLMQESTNPASPTEWELVGTCLRPLERKAAARRRKGQARQHINPRTNTEREMPVPRPIVEAIRSGTQDHHEQTKGQDEFDRMKPGFLKLMMGDNEIERHRGVWAERDDDSSSEVVGCELLMGMDLD